MLNEEGGHIVLAHVSCSYMSEKGVATVDARAHPILNKFGVKSS